MRFSIVIVGGAALALAACGGSGGANGRSSGGTTSTATAGGGVQGGIGGQITRLSGGSLVLRGPSGNVSVTFSSTTNVLQTSSATQSNIVAGACVVVTGQRESAGPVTADSVQVQYNMNGNCAPPPGVVLGRSGPGTAVNLRGKITSVSGSSFVMAPVTTGGALVTVNVPSSAGLTRQDTATTSRLAVGQCLRVNGQQDAAGVVQARALIITQAGSSGCSGSSRGQTPPPRSAAPGA